MAVRNLRFINGAFVPQTVSPRTVTAPTIVTPHYLVVENNLSDVADAEEARTNLGITSGGRQHANLTHADNGTTLSADFDDYFVSLNFGGSYSVTLPDAELMEGRELTFKNITHVFEAWFTINGPIEDSSSFTLSGHSSVKLLCDGTNWWVTNSYMAS